MATGTATQTRAAKPSRQEKAATLFEGQGVDPTEAVETPVSETVETESTPEPTETNANDAPATPIENVAAESQAAAETAAVSPFVQKVSELGFANVKDENEARDRLLESYQTQLQQQQAIQAKMAEMQQYATYGQQYLQKMQDPNFQQFLAQSQQPAGEKKKEENWWSPPTFDQTWIERYREVDPTTGTPKWKEGTPADVKVNAEQYQAYIEKWSDDLVRRPHEVLPKIIREEARRLFQEEFQQRTAEQETQNFATQVKEQNQEWLFAKDPRTQGVMTDPVSGQPFYSPEGQRAMQWVAHAEKIGIGDPREQWDYAVTKLQIELNRSPASTQAATNGNAADNSKLALLKKGAGHIANRAGSEAPIETPNPRSQNPHLSAGRKLVADLQRNGFEFR